MPRKDQQYSVKNLFWTRQPLSSREFCLRGSVAADLKNTHAAKKYQHSFIHQKHGCCWCFWKNPGNI